MKPPRYLLREFAVLRLLRTMPPARFLEIGYGKGQMLVTLARHGFRGQGFDLSEQSFERATVLLASSGIDSVSLIEELPGNEKFDYVFFFEVIGYLDDPVVWLDGLQQLLSDSGRLIFSFTNQRHCGDAERLTGDMRCFTRGEVSEILGQAGFELDVCWNYGYPLSNWLRPLLNGLHRRRDADDAGKEGAPDAVRRSGFGGVRGVLAPLVSVVSPLLVLPFKYLQLLFRASDLGTGYIVLASSKKRQAEVE